MSVDAQRTAVHRARRASPPASRPTGDPDLALVVNDGPDRAAAAVFTSNRVKAAPGPLVASRSLADGRGCTPSSSTPAAPTPAPAPRASRTRTPPPSRSPSVLGGLGAGDVAVCSTGLIGERLPMDKLLAGRRRRRRPRSPPHGGDDGRGDRDHDHRHRAQDGRRHAATAGPSAAWPRAPACSPRRSPPCSCVLTTDADARRRGARRARCAPPRRVTFDRVDSDGCMSTNDTVLLLASGASGVAPGPRTSSPTAVARGLRTTSPGSCIADAEGATKDIAIEVVNAASEDDAVEVGRSVARNNLLKCAIYGEDPNWGRVLSAVGTTEGRLRTRPARRRHQRRLGLQERRRSARTATWSTCATARSSIIVDLRRRRRDRDASGPTTSPPTTSTRTARTRS